MMRTVYKVGSPVEILPCNATDGKPSGSVIIKEEHFKNGQTMVWCRGFHKAIPANKVVPR